jgi:hypothetical protein
MAITKVINGVTTAVDLATATAFSITDPTTITADNFAVGEYAIVHRLGPSGEYRPATNRDGSIVLSALPNIVLLDAPATYKVTKTVTAVAAYVGYEA